MNRGTDEVKAYEYASSVWLWKQKEISCIFGVIPFVGPVNVDGPLKESSSSVSWRALE